MPPLRPPFWKPHLRRPHPTLALRRVDVIDVIGVIGVVGVIGGCFAVPDSNGYGNDDVTDVRCAVDADCDGGVCALVVCGVDVDCGGCDGYVGVCVDDNNENNENNDAGEGEGEGEGEPLPPCEIRPGDDVIDGSVVLEDAASVNQFATKTAITGDLFIVVPPGTDLRALQGLTAVGGSLVVDAAVDLTPLAGISCVSDDLDLHTFVAASFPALTTVRGSVHVIGPGPAVGDLSFLANLVSVGDDFHVESSAFLSLAGVEHLRTVGGVLRFDDVDGSVDPNRHYGLPGLHSVGVLELRAQTPHHVDLPGVSFVGALDVDGATVFDLDLSAAVFVGDVVVHDTQGLSTLSLPQASEAGRIVVDDNADLARVSLPALRLRGPATLEANPVLEDVDLGAAAGAVRIVDNAALDTCAAERVAVRAGSVADGVVVDVEGNGGASCRCQ